MELQYPDRFITPVPYAPPAKWAGTVSDLLELTVCLQHAGIIVKPTGERMSWSDVIIFIGQVFGLKIQRPYERKTKLFIRKRDETPFLHRLITVFRSEVEKYYQ